MDGNEVTPKPVERSACRLLILNQMAGPMTWELAVDLTDLIGPVTVLTGHPDTLAKGPVNNLTIVPSTPYHRGSLVARFWSWLRYSFHAFCWLWRFPPGTPVLVFSNPPIMIWVMRLIWILRATPYAVMVHDIFPDVLTRKKVLSPDHFVIRVWRRWNRHAYQSAQLVMTLGRYMADNLSRQFDPSRTAAETIRVLPPWSDDRQLSLPDGTKNWFVDRYGLAGKLTLMYSGNMGLGHDMESMFQAAENLSVDPGIQVMLIGSGPKWDWVKQSQDEKQLPNLTILGWQDESDLPYSLSAADVALVSLEEEMSGLAVPSKAFYFLAANVPILAVCHQDTELAEMIIRFQCGAVVAPGRPDEIEAVVRRLRSDPAILPGWKRATRLAMQEYSRRRSTREFARLLSQFLETPDPGHPEGQAAMRQSCPASAPAIKFTSE